MFDLSKLPTHYAGRRIIDRITHTIKAPTVRLKPGQAVIVGEEGSGVVWRMDKPLEAHRLVTRMYALDGEGRVLNEQPKVLPFFVDASARNLSMLEHMGNLRPIYDATTPGTVFYELNTPLVMTRAMSIGLTYKATTESFEVAGVLAPNDSTHRVMKFGGILIETFLEGAILVVSSELD